MVDFPHPLGPTKETMHPFSSSNERSMVLLGQLLNNLLLQRTCAFPPFEEAVNVRAHKVIHSMPSSKPAALACSNR